MAAASTYAAEPGGFAAVAGASATGFPLGMEVLGLEVEVCVSHWGVAWPCGIVLEIEIDVAFWGVAWLGRGVAACCCAAWGVAGGWDWLGGGCGCTCPQTLVSSPGWGVGGVPSRRVAGLGHPWGS